MRPSRRHAFGLMPCLARSLGLGGFAPARRGVFRASAAMNGNVFRQSGRARCLAISRAGDSVGGRFSRYGKTGLARWVSAVFLRRGKIFFEWEWSALAAGGGCPRRFLSGFFERLGRRTGRKAGNGGVSMRRIGGDCGARDFRIQMEIFRGNGDLKNFQHCGELANASGGGGDGFRFYRASWPMGPREKVGRGVWRLRKDFFRAEVKTEVRENFFLAPGANCV